ncbi:hypothetical protein DSL72_002401 [Monilinia vaccinii-corymbosi]|uniref:Uncharacterized protein n=1 Tax=Monilinia vaccinii-corymbosi TaxID=61207 RepID=A0A8A3PCL1_9HELO|nr:hypothetical protein DSL72_002401 [Monilinia vaccinii-corymbosi]
MESGTFVKAGDDATVDAGTQSRGGAAPYLSDDLAKGFIEPSQLDAPTRKDRYPLTLVEETLAQLQDTKIYRFQRNYNYNMTEEDFRLRVPQQSSISDKPSIAFEWIPKSLFPCQRYTATIRRNGTKRIKKSSKNDQRQLDRRIPQEKDQY